MKIKILVVLVLFGIVIAEAQTNINDYKYVTVPYFFEFVKGKNAHRLNTTTRFLLKKHGLNAFMDDELNAVDYKNNNCLALKTDVVKVTALLKTKLKVILINCNDEIVYQSKVGESKAKSYDEAYTEALIDAFESFASLNYQYVPHDKETLLKEPEEIINQVEEKEIIEQELASEKAREEVIAQVTKAEDKVEEKLETIEEAKEVLQKKSKTSNVLFAQASNAGYQVVDHTPKVVMILLKTSVPNVFVVKDENAIVFKEGEVWFISKNIEGKISKKPLELKF